MTSATRAANSSMDQNRTFQLTRKHVIGAFVVFFLIVAATDAVLIWLAVSTFGGLETKDAYRKGLDYNRNISEAAVQAGRGWRETVSFDATGGAIEVRIADDQGRAVEGLAIKATIGRPAVNWSDKTLSFNPAGDGRYVAEAGGLSAGTWVASIEAREAGAPEGTVSFRSKVRLWKQP